jgi:hypothetical protein
MTIAPSSRTATVAGVWSAAGFVPFDAWLRSHPAAPALVTSMLWVPMAVFFLIVPGTYLVIGRSGAPFRRLWFMDTQERARRLVVVKRMVIWLLSAAVAGTVWSFLLYLAWPTLWSA